MQIIAVTFIAILLTSSVSNSLPNLSKQASAMQLLFQDGYSNSGWSQVGSQVTVNSLSFPGIVKFNNVAGGGGVNDNRVVKKLPAALPSGNWTADFDYTFTSSSLVRDFIFNLSATPIDPWLDTSPDIITVEHGFGVDQLVVELGPRSSTVSAGIPISPNMPYHVRLDKTPTLLTLSIFSDKARTHQIAGSPVTLPISSSNFNGSLNYIQHDGCSACGPARTLTAQLDNTRIFVKETSQILFQTNYGEPVWTQVGSQITANSLSFPGIVKLNNVIGGGGVTQNRVIKHLPSALPSGNWTADFSYKFTASTIPGFLVFDITTTSDDPQALSPANRILIEHGLDVDQLFITSSGSIPTDSTHISISPNTQYYVRLAKTSTQLELSVFSNPARTINVPGSPVTSPILATDFNGTLNYIQHDGCTLCGNSRTLTAQIDNMQIFGP